MQPLQTQPRSSTRIRNNGCQCIAKHTAQDGEGCHLDCRSARCDSRCFDMSPSSPRGVISRDVFRLLRSGCRLVHARKEVGSFWQYLLLVSGRSSGQARGRLVKLEHAVPCEGLGSLKTVVPMVVVEAATAAFLDY